VFSEYLASDYWINDSNSIGASYQMNCSFDNYSTGWARQEIKRNGMMEGIVNATSDVNPKYEQHALNTYYQGKIGKMGIDLNGTYFYGTNERKDLNVETSNELDDRTVHSNSKETSHLYAAKLILDYPVLGGKMKLGTELTKTKSHGVFINEEGFVSSSETDIKEHNIAGFVQYELSLNHWMMGAGVRYEDVTREYYLYGKKQDDVCRKYHNIFPNLSLAWSKGDWSWQLSMNEKMHRPSYRSLRNYMQYDNRYMYEGGNPKLQPEKVYNVETGATYRWLSATVGYTYTKDAMLWVKYLMENQEVTYTTNLNFDHYQSVYASISISPRFKVYRPTLEINYDRQKFDAKEYGVDKNLNKPTLGARLNNKFVFSPSLMAGLIIKGRTCGYNGFVVSRPQVSVDASVRKSFDKDRWVITLKANDIFKTAREQWTMYGIGAEATKDCYNYNRSISLLLTYNFNSTRNKYKGTGAGNEERRRL
jgi:hypothetical protein